MSDRRQFVKAGLCVPMASLASSSLTWTQAYAGDGAMRQLERFIYDVRFTESYDVAQSIGRQGVALSPIADDLMNLWYDELDLLWKQAPRTLGGITMPEALFVLETFALDRGMRVVYRGEHSALSEGNIAHELTGPATMLEEISRGSAHWTDRLAQAMMLCPATNEAASQLSFASRSNAPALRDVPLQSWILAPLSARTNDV